MIFLSACLLTCRGPDTNSLSIFRVMPFATTIMNVMLFRICLCRLIGLVMLWSSATENLRYASIKVFELGKRSLTCTSSPTVLRCNQLWCETLLGSCFSILVTCPHDIVFFHGRCILFGYAHTVSSNTQ